MNTFVKHKHRFDTILLISQWQRPLTRSCPHPCARGRASAMSVIICIVGSFVVCVIGVFVLIPDSASFLFASCLPIYLVRRASLSGCILSSPSNGCINSSYRPAQAVAVLFLNDFKRLRWVQNPVLDIYIYRSLICLRDSGIKAHYYRMSESDLLYSWA